MWCQTKDHLWKWHLVQKVFYRKQAYYQHVSLGYSTKYIDIPFYYRKHYELRSPLKYFGIEFRGNMYLFNVIITIKFKKKRPPKNSNENHKKLELQAPLLHWKILFIKVSCKDLIILSRSIIFKPPFSFQDCSV